MPYEKGGRADKKGNKYEINCIVYELLKVLDGSNYSVVIEPWVKMRREQIFWLRIMKVKRSISNVKQGMEVVTIGRFRI